MGRGMLTREEASILKENPYVESVSDSRITYSEEFKLLFLKEYFDGKKPMRIFEDAGFDVKALGSKRIERCSARWREANASGSLGERHEANDFYEKNENEKLMMRRIIADLQQQVEELERQVEQLQDQIAKQA